MPNASVAQTDPVNASEIIANEETAHKEHQKEIEIEKQSTQALNTNPKIVENQKENVPEINQPKPTVSATTPTVLEQKHAESLPTIETPKKVASTTAKTITVNKIKDISVKHYKDSEYIGNKSPVKNDITDNSTQDLTVEVPTPQPMIVVKEQPAIQPHQSQPVVIKQVKIAKVDSKQLVKIKPSHLKLPELITDEERERLKGRYTIQIAAKTDKQTAQKLASSLLKKNYPAHIVYTQTKPSPFYRVWVGEFPKEKSATLFAKTLKKKKVINEYIVKTW